MWRSTELASLEKKPSMRLSHDPCVGVNVKVAANGLRRQPARGLARDMGGMVVENDLDRGVGGVGGVESLDPPIQSPTGLLPHLVQHAEANTQHIDISESLY